MKIIDMRDYTPAARAYWWGTVVAGYATLGWALGHIASQDASIQLQVFGLAIAAAIVGLFPVRIPGTKMSVAAGEIFIFLALLLNGPLAGVIAAALEGFVASWRTSRR